MRNPKEAGGQASLEGTKSQIDKLGIRLREDQTEDDLLRLDVYRHSFGDAYRAVMGALDLEMGLNPTGRPHKTTGSIVEKLRREKTRLSSMQDIAGCRIVVPTCADQDQTVQRIRDRFQDSKSVDRRNDPSHGYRAVHVVVQLNGKLIEVQVRTELQHAWAELSEKLADLLGIDVKYGGGENEIKDLLGVFSRNVAEAERLEDELAGVDRDDPKYAEVAGRAQTLKMNVATAIAKLLATLERIGKKG